MNGGELFFDGLKLMILGMGVVFAFLILMIFLMGLMSKLLALYTNLFAVAAPKASAPKTSKNDAELAAAAVASIKLFENK